MKLKRMLATLGSAAALTVGLVGLSPAAHAATPGCTDYAIYYSGSSNAWYTKVPTVGPQGTNFCTLRSGASGMQVYYLQDTLNRCYGQDLGELDGKFGPKTAAALARVQKSLGLDPDGVYGPQTRDKLAWHWMTLQADNHCKTLYEAHAH
ncbi:MULTISPECIES: peptidoglycan-binding domain-containing protein [unclassified Streptomyces]|uniref:peptidoglycan-binding domain-containing protein n=1 Tax=unclassified Streptomyces TaxID=2593676 RepID=UPI00300912E5